MRRWWTRWRGPAGWSPWWILIVSCFTTVLQSFLFLIFQILFNVLFWSHTYKISHSYIHQLCEYRVTHTFLKLHQRHCGKTENFTRLFHKIETIPQNHQWVSMKWQATFLVASESAQTKASPDCSTKPSSTSDWWIKVMKMPWRSSTVRNLAPSRK